MHRTIRYLSYLGTGALLAGVPLAGAGTAYAADAPSTVYVASAPGGCGGASPYSTISTAVDAVSDGGTVVVCKGTYAEDVVVTKPVSIVGHDNPVVDASAATNSPLFAMVGSNAFTVLAPGVSIRNLTVQGGTGDGILALGDHAHVSGVRAFHNGYAGIDFNGSSYSTAENNIVENNVAGIQLANDPEAAGISLPGSTGTATHDRVIGNHIRHNQGACGIIVVDHAGTQTGEPNWTGGVYDNYIARNQVTDNGTMPDSPGAGIIIASPAPGGAVYDNVVTGNTFAGNGMGGVVIHAHIPGQYLSGNRIEWNTIGTNNLVGDEGDTDTTGVYVGAAGPISVTVAHNRISHDHIGIFAAGPSVRVRGDGSNWFSDVDVHVLHVPTFG